jgi:hypothetical protein
MSNETLNKNEIINLGIAIERSHFKPVVEDNFVISACVKMTGWLEKTIADALPVIDEFCKEKYGEFDNQTRICTLCNFAAQAAGLNLSDYDYVIFEHLASKAQN